MKSTPQTLFAQLEQAIDELNDLLAKHPKALDGIPEKTIQDLDGIKKTVEIQKSKALQKVQANDPEKPELNKNVFLYVFQISFVEKYPQKLLYECEKQNKQSGAQQFLKTIYPEVDKRLASRAIVMVVKSDKGEFYLRKILFQNNGSSWRYIDPSFSHYQYMDVNIMDTIVLPPSNLKQSDINTVEINISGSYSFSLETNGNVNATDFGAKTNNPAPLQQIEKEFGTIEWSLVIDRVSTVEEPRANSLFYEVYPQKQ